MLDAWGILDPFAEQIGQWLGANISAGQFVWTASTALAIAAYFIALWAICRALRNRIRVTGDSIFESTGSTPDFNPDDLGASSRYLKESGWVEFGLRNNYSTGSVENLDVTFANFSVNMSTYDPIDVLKNLKATPRGTTQGTINAKDQKYFRFARVQNTQDTRQPCFILLSGVPRETFSGQKCIVKIRFSAKQVPGRIEYYDLRVDDFGNLSISEYKRIKTKNLPDGYKPLLTAALDAWEQIRGLPEFDASPSHSPEFASLRDYYERYPLKLPGIAAQIILNNAKPPIPIEGIAPPRTAIETIPPDKASGYRFSDDALEMFDIFDTDKPRDQRRRYTDLRVKWADVERRIKAIEEDNG